MPSDKGWRRRFDEPIPLPRGRQLVTLKDAGNFITKLPKAAHDAEEWQAAMQALLLVAERGGPTMLEAIKLTDAKDRSCSLPPIDPSPNTVQHRRSPAR